MSKEIVIHPKYLPLYQLLNGEHPQVDTVIITGGRYSAKSFNIGLFSVIALVDYNRSVLFTRYTNTSIVDSIKPNVDDKIDLLGYQDEVVNTATHIERGKNRIAFKGIKTGSYQQTANLKSLENFDTFVVDEADEMPDYDTFEKVYLSIRSLDKRNITILSLNPSHKQHWIFKDFYKKHGLKGGENTIVDNVMYIHTCYLDVPKKYIPENFIKYYEKLKLENPKKYKHVVLGEWNSEIEGRVFNDWVQIGYLDWLKVEALPHFSIDFGTHDPTAILEWKFVKRAPYDYHLYLHERYYKSENQTRDEMPDHVKQNYKREDGGILLYIMNLCGIDKNRLAICDAGGGGQDFRANNFKIAMLQQNGYVNIKPSIKFPGSIHLGVELLKNTTVYYTKESENLEFEYENFTLDSDREGFIDGKYEDKNNHLIDCAKNIMLFLFKSGLVEKSV